MSLDDFDTRFTAYLEAYPEDADRISSMSSYEDIHQELDRTQGYPILEKAAMNRRLPGRGAPSKNNADRGTDPAG